MNESYIMESVRENEEVPIDQLQTLASDRLVESESVSDDAFVSLARKARNSGAFAPYSEFPVGAALLTEQGLYLGANIEISGRSTSVHAEMLAAYKAVFEGATSFKVMAVSTPRQNANTGPCGLCQHTLSQFTEELRILEDGGEGNEHGEFWLSGLIGDGYSASTRHMEKIRENQ